MQLRVVPPVRAPTKTSRVKPRPPPHLRQGAAAARAGRRALLQPAAHGGRGRAALRTAVGRGAYTRALHRLLQPSPSLNPNPEAPAPTPTPAPKPEARSSGSQARALKPASPRSKPDTRLKGSHTTAIASTATPFPSLPGAVHHDRGAGHSAHPLLPLDARPPLPSTRAGTRPAPHTPRAAHARHAGAHARTPPRAPAMTRGP